MPHIMTRRQALQCAAFLRALGETGNATIAAAAAGAHRTTFDRRRRAHAGFAADWEATLAAAGARLMQGGGPHCAVGRRGALRTAGGEQTVSRGKHRGIQLRRARPGEMTAAAEQAFLRALAASANVRLAAEAAGVSSTIIYRHRKARPAFARAFAEALATGYDRLHIAMHHHAKHALSGTGHEDADSWFAQSLDDPIPRMTFSEMLHLLYIHQKSVVLERDRHHPAQREPTIEEVYDKVRAHLSALRRAEEYEATGKWDAQG